MAEATGVYLADADDNDAIDEENGSITRTNAAMIHGTDGYQLNFAGASASVFCEETLPSAYTDIYARVYINIPTAFADNFSNYNTIIPLALRDESTATDCIYVRLEYFSGSFRTNRLYYYRDAGVAYVAMGSTVLSYDTDYYLEIRYLSDDGAGAVECWLDGVSEASATGLSNSTYEPDRVRWGNTGGNIPDNGDVLYLDDLKVDTSAIGAYSDVGGGAVAPTGTLSGPLGGPLAGVF